MRWILETERLRLREIIVADAPFFFALNSDPEVIRYTGDDAFTDIHAAETFLKGYDHYTKYGFGRWAMVTKGEEKIVGWCGLKYSPEVDEYDLGYRLFRDEWGKGYATEAGIACLHMGFEEFNMPMIVGRALKANTGSIRVLEKCGMHFWKEEMEHGEQAVIYRCFPHDIR